MKIEDVFTVHDRTMIVGCPRADESFSFGPVQVRNQNGVMHRGKLVRVEDLASNRTVLSPDGRYGFVLSGLAAAHISVGGELLPGALSSDVVVGEGSNITSAVGRSDVQQPLVPEQPAAPSEPPDGSPVAATALDSPDAIDLEAFARRLAADLKAEAEAGPGSEEKSEEKNDAVTADIAADIANKVDLTPAPSCAMCGKPKTFVACTVCNGSGEGSEDHGNGAIEQLGCHGCMGELGGWMCENACRIGEPAAAVVSDLPGVSGEPLGAQDAGPEPAQAAAIIDAVSEVVNIAPVPTNLSEEEEEAQAREEDPSAIGAQKRAAARRRKRKEP